MRRAELRPEARGTRRSHTRAVWRSRVLWFVALYGAGLAAVAAVSLALRTLIAA